MFTAGGEKAGKGELVAKGVKQGERKSRGEWVKGENG